MNKYIVLLMLIIPVGCASRISRLQAYNSLKTNSNGEQVVEINDIMRMNKAINTSVPLLEEFQLDDKSPVIKVGGFFSYYKAWKINVADEFKHKFKLKTVGDMDTRFEEKVMIPHLVIFNDEGVAVYEGPDSPQVKTIVRLIIKPCFDEKWEFKFPKKGNYFILFYAINNPNFEPQLLKTTEVSGTFGLNSGNSMNYVPVSSGDMFYFSSPIGKGTLEIK